MSNNKNNNVDRFQFVTMDELNDSLTDNNLEENLQNHEIEKIEEDHATDQEEKSVAIDEVEDSVEDSVENTSDIVSPVDNKLETVNHYNDKDSEDDKKHKLHLGFEVRIAIMIICILCLFIGACLLILETVRNSEEEVVSYKESSSVQYNVCLLANQRFNTSCLTEDLEYESELVDTINAHFSYDVNFSTDISYNMFYHVDAVTKIYDKNDVNKILYTSTDTIKDKVILDDVSNYISFETDIILDYQKYNDGAVYYQNRYFLDSKAVVEMILYLDEPHGTRKIASLVIPLGVSSFTVQKNVVSNTTGSVSVDGNFWNHYNAICALIASILIIVALFLLYRTTLLVLKVTSKRSEYQQTLANILREYDRIIVIARDGYESNYVKEVVKLETFDDLLEARNELLKPIIYSRVNDVKSEFLVEDDDKLYKYVIKESDFK